MHQGTPPAPGPSLAGLVVRVAHASLLSDLGLAQWSGSRHCQVTQSPEAQATFIHSAVPWTAAPDSSPAASSPELHAIVNPKAAFDIELMAGGRRNSFRKWVCWQPVQW